MESSAQVVNATDVEAELSPSVVVAWKPESWEAEYARCVRNSERVAWRLDQVLPPGVEIDLGRATLPGGLTQVERLCDLDGSQQRLLSQIMGHAYVNLFAFIEEYIVAQATRQAHAELFGSLDIMRALLRMADEEIKHQQLFCDYMSRFRGAFGEAEVLSNATEVAGVILSKSPIAVALVTLHLELVTQHHYVSSVRAEDEIDPLFASLLKHHWLEEAQHAKIDALELGRMLQWARPDDLGVAFEDYLQLAMALSALLYRQATLDVETLCSRTGHSPSGRAAEGWRNSESGHAAA